MMNVISVENIQKRFADEILLDSISMGLSAGQKVALVGKNGCGKSTLLRIMAGDEQPDRGKVVLREGVTLAFLPQQPYFNPGDTILDAAMESDDPLLKLVSDYQHALTSAGDSEASMEHLMEVSGKMDAMQAWSLEAEVREVLGKLGLHEVHRQVRELSGGMQKRIGLAQALLRHPDILLLDEPTNHLDVEAIEWLEKYLSKSQVTLIMVTHDRYFLENITTEIVEIDRGSIHRYEGNYSYFLEKKQERQENEEIQQDKARNLMRKELDWIRRQPKARGTKAKYRVDAFHDLSKAAQRTGGKENLLLDVAARRQGGNVLELQEVDKSYDGNLVLPPFSYTFKKKERIGLAGPNGSGKTTFLNLLTGEIRPDSGNVIPGVNTHFGYYKQQEPRFADDKKVIEIVRECAEVITLSDGSQVSSGQLLQRFNFPPKKQYDYVAKLSGGEKRRLQLLLVLLENPNFLILDEPTNDLDIYTLQVLEDFLLNFGGCLMLVSHDRYFMDRLVDHLFIFEKGTSIAHFNGKYTDYREEIQSRNKSDAKAKIDKSKKVREEKKGGMSFREKQELKEIESKLESLAERKTALLKELDSGLTDHEKLHEITSEMETIMATQDELELRWLELSEKEA
jgi:ATP-binding cassette subfamily F protein uup